MTTKELHELNEAARNLSYEAIRASGLYKSLSNEQWDAKAIVYGHLVVELIKNLIAEDETALESAREEGSKQMVTIETLSNGEFEVHGGDNSVLGPFRSLEAAKSVQRMFDQFRPGRRNDPRDAGDDARRDGDEVRR